MIIPNGSVHLILTDPPYGDEAEPLYQWLAELSARVLVEGCSLLCFTGQSRLSRDIKIFDEHLRYWWEWIMWGQGNGGVEYPIEQLTDPGGLIVDPFAGAGQWGKIAERMGRTWIGADVVQGGDTVIVA